MTRQEENSDTDLGEHEASDAEEDFPAASGAAVDFGWDDKRPLTGRRLKTAKDKQKKLKAGSFGKIVFEFWYIPETSSRCAQPIACSGKSFLQVAIATAFSKQVHTSAPVHHIVQSGLHASWEISSHAQCAMQTRSI